MLSMLLWRQCGACIRKHTVMVSLMFIAVNPMSGNDSERSANEDSRPHLEQSVMQDGVPSGQDRLKSYLRLGQLQGFQNTIANECQAFLASDTIEDGTGMFNGGSSLSGLIPNFALPYSATDGLIDSVNGNGFLGGLIAMYLKRIETLAKNQDSYDEALQEIEKIYIIDPSNEKAQAVEAFIRKNQKRKVENVKNNDATSAGDVPASSREEAQDRVLDDLRACEELKSARLEDGAKRERLKNEKQSALCVADRQLSKVMMPVEFGGDAEMAIKDFYDSGKKLFAQEKYFESVVFFRKVLALDGNHVYATYARRFISLAFERIREKEEQDLGVIVGGDSAAVADGVVVSSEDMLTQGVGEEKSAQFNEKVDAILENVGILIEQEKSFQAINNLQSLLILDENNEEAEALLHELKEKHAKKVVEAEERRVRDEEDWRNEYSATVDRRHGAYNALRQKYALWHVMNVQAVTDELDKKGAELLRVAEGAFDERDYFYVQQCLDRLFVLNPDHAQGKLLEESLCRIIADLQKLVPAPSQQDKGDVSLQKGYCESAVAKKEGLVKQGTCPVGADAGFYSEQRAHQVMHPLTNDPSDEHRIVEEHLVQMRSDSESEAAVLPITLMTQKDEPKAEVFESVFAQQADKGIEQKKIEQCMERGKRHLRQGNYPLALVAFNKAQTMDATHVMADEIALLIEETTEQLEKRKD